MAQPPTAASAASAMVLSISRHASRRRNWLRSRAISGRSAFDIGLTNNAIGTVMPRRQ
jgi:hypothetical protein